MRGIVAVACSGGRDSLALLHATAVAARAKGLDVVALHIHHGLLPEADAWFDHVESMCRRWASEDLPVRFIGRRLGARPRRGESVEAWAREARYAALADLAREAGAGLVLLGHHRKDQAETFLLQALRGAGVAGLSAMPACIERDGLVWQRPWLDVPRAHIEQYVRQCGLESVEDPSNTDPRFARNRLREAVWPALAAAFPDADVALAASARWAQQATQVLDEVAAADLATCSVGEQLDIAAWSQLTEARRVNALRAWLRERTGEPAAAALVERLRTELSGTRPASWAWGGGELRRYRGRLSFGPTASVASPSRESTLAIRRAGRYRLPGWGGAFHATRVDEGGVPLAWLAHLDLRERQGGEQFQSGFSRPARSLKKQYQAAGVPEWERGGPLVFSGGQLVFVPGLGIDARVVGLPGQAQMMLAWEPANVTGG